MPTIPSVCGNGVNDQSALAIQERTNMAIATFVLRFQNNPNTTTQKTGTNQENNHSIAAMIGGKNDAMPMAIKAITIIAMRMTFATSFSDACGL